MKKTIIIPLLIALLTDCVQEKEEVPVKEKITGNTQLDTAYSGNSADTLSFMGCTGSTVYGHLNDDYFLVISGNLTPSMNGKLECTSKNCDLIITVEKKEKGIQYSNPCSDIGIVDGPKPHIIRVKDMKLIYWTVLEDGHQYFNCKIKYLELEDKTVFKHVYLKKVSIDAIPG